MRSSSSKWGHGNTSSILLGAGLALLLSAYYFAIVDEQLRDEVKAGEPAAKLASETMHNCMHLFGGMGTALGGLSLIVWRITKGKRRRWHAKPCPRAMGVSVDADRLSIELVDGRRLAVPLAWFPRLLAAPAAQRANWRLLDDGQGINWPDLDEDLSVDGLLGGSTVPAPSV